MTYQGHKNWNYWNVSLHIHNTEPIYKEAVDLCRKYPKDKAALLLLAQLPSTTMDGAPYTFTAVRAALREL